MSTQTMGDPVSAIKEKDAVGEIASLFSEIRTTLGTSSVNLIWRHLATFPGALPWCWRAIAPLFESGELREAARDYRAGLKGLECPEMPADVRQVLGLRHDDLALISSTLRGYYASCTMNILSLNALLVLMKSPQPRQPASAPVSALHAAAMRAPVEQMARLLDPSEMPPQVAELAWRLNALGERGDGRILASLYRYLANWPAFLGATWMLVTPYAMSGQLHLAVADTLAAADVHARRLSNRLDPAMDAMDAATLQAVRVALEEFGRNAIAKVIPITRGLMMVVGTRLGG